jgi:hypothetical protein
VYFGCREETIVGIVGPVEGNGCGKGDEEGVEAEEGLAGVDEAVAKAWPVPD